MKNISNRIRNVLAAVALLASTVPVWADIQFSVDYACFRSPHPDSTSVEIYHSVPYDQLHYQAFGDTIYAEYQILLKLTDLMTGVSTTQMVYEPARIPSFEEARRRQVSIAHSFSLNLIPGRYFMEMTVRDTAAQGLRTDTLVVRDLRRKPSVSDPIIGDRLVQAPSGGTSVLPRPSRSFGPGSAREMYVFLDGYDFVADTLPYEVNALILNDSGRTIKSLPPELKRKPTGVVHEIFGLTTQGLTPGTYRLRVSLRDLANDSVAWAAKTFYVQVSAPAVKPETALAATLSADERKEYDDIRYLASDQEMRQFKKLKPAGQAEFLRRFWKTHDFRAYLDRLQTADTRYSWGSRRGRDTDQGRIFLRYGEPDEVEVHTMIEHALPHEHWHYYQAGLQFIFVDVRSDGFQRMVYSNSDQEHNDPNWEKLVDPLELEQLQQR